MRKNSASGTGPTGRRLNAGPFLVSILLLVLATGCETVLRWKDRANEHRYRANRVPTTGDPVEDDAQGSVRAAVERAEIEILQGRELWPT